MKLIQEVTTWLKALLLAAKAITRNEIYVLRTKAIGDVLWAEPIIRKLAEQKQTIYVITDFPDLFQNYPYSNVQFIANLDKKYKRAAKFLHSVGSKKHVFYLTHAYENNQNIHFLHAYQQAAALPVTNEYPKIYISEAEKNKYKKLQPYAVIHLESTSPLDNRQVYGIAWESVFAHLSAIGITPYIIAKNPLPDQLPYHLQTAGLRDMIAVINNATLFIGLDSGPSHIAACLQVPAIVFFGSINPWYRHFKELFQGVIMQQPCEFAHCYHRAQKGKKDHSCLLTGTAKALQCCTFNGEEINRKIDTLLQQKISGYSKAE